MSVRALLCISILSIGLFLCMDGDFNAKIEMKMKKLCFPTGSVWVYLGCCIILFLAFTVLYGGKCVFPQIHLGTAFFFK